MKQARLTLLSTAVTNNTASGTTATGGGILNQKTLTMNGSLVSDNSVNASGGNAQGGGLFNSDLGPSTLTNSSVSRTRATARGGTSEGGGIFNKNDVSGSVTLSNTPVAANKPNNCRPVGSVPGCSG